MMRFILIILLIVIFAYSLGLVLINSTPVTVDLWFTHDIPEMRLGLLVLITLALGVAIGLLLGVQVFRVFQNRWEIKRLHKEIERLRKEQIEIAKTAAADAVAQTRHEKTVLDINSNNQSPL